VVRIFRPELEEIVIIMADIKCVRKSRKSDNEIMRSTVWLSIILLPE
jgi:hypothetical protein